jgi:hypothetical protein
LRLNWYGLTSDVLSVPKKYTSGTRNSMPISLRSGAVFLLLAVAGCAQLRAADGALTADSYVSTAAPNSNFGVQTTLNAGGGSTAFVQFDLSSLPAGTTTASIASAQLIFYVDRVGVAGSVDLHTVAAPWTETTLTASSSSITPTAFATVAVAQVNAFTTVDVTSLVQNWVAGTTPNYGIAMTAAASASNTQIFLDSKENTATSHPARLQINLTGAGSTGLTGPAGLAGPQGQPGPIGAPGSFPYPFTTVTNSSALICSDINLSIRWCWRHAPSCGQTL